MKPTFIGIGAQKCASTWLYAVLRDHPQAALSDVKELNFFSGQFDRGYPWYERQFGRCEDAVAVGEISPSYFHEPAVPERVRAYAPQARILVSLRDPVERALSHHRHAARVGDVVGRDLCFEAALPRNPMYREQGRYATHLGRWLHHFPREQVLVVFYDDIVRYPADTARRVYRFLGIGTEFSSAAVEERANASHVTPFGALENTRAKLRGGVRSLGLDAVWEAAARAGARRLYRQINRRPSAEHIPRPARSTLDELRDGYRDEIERLEALTGRDLSAWRAPAADRWSATDAPMEVALT